MKSNVVVSSHDGSYILFDLVAGIEIYVLVVQQLKKL